MMHYPILIKTRVAKIDADEWKKMFFIHRTLMQVLESTRIGKTGLITTYFTGLGPHEHGRKMLFKTVTLNNGIERLASRYATYNETMDGHRRIVEREGNA